MLNDYSSIVSYKAIAKYKIIHGKVIPSMSVRVARGKVFGYWNLKILSPKQMLQRLPKALGQVKGGNASIFG